MALAAHQLAATRLRWLARARAPSRRSVSSRALQAVSWVTEPHPQAQAAPDAVVVLAGGLTPDGGLPEWVSRRLDAAHDLHVMHSHQPPILCLGAGTPHKPPMLSPTNYVVHEATSCARYLLDKGMAPSALLKETCSYDTVGNAYFSLTTHAVPAGWRRLAVVTSAFHLPRTRVLFEDMYALAGRQLFGSERWFDLSFWPVTDEGIFEAHVLQARIDKEAGSVATWRLEQQRHQLSTLQSLHSWLHHTHLCYSVDRQHEFGQPTELSPELAASY